MAESKLKDTTVGYLRTLDRARERVSSWPQWKRETIQYRYSESTKAVVLKCDALPAKRQS